MERVSHYVTILRTISRAVLVVLVLNCGFLFLVLFVPIDSPTIRHRIRAAFETGDLGFEDYRLFDSRRGFFQYNDCNVLQMIANRNPSRVARALSPIVYSANDDWTNQCAVLHRVTLEGADVAGLIENHYSRYWHGYNVGVAIALRAMELRTLRRFLVATVWLSLAGFTAVMIRSGRAFRRVGLAIALAATLLWAVPYFDPGFTFGFGDAAVLLGLAGLAARPHIALNVATLVPFAAGFGAVVVFFEMLTGQLPVAAAWLVAVIVAARRDHASSAIPDVRVLAIAALVAFGVGAVATVTIKQVVAYTLVDPGAGRAFFSHLLLYASLPEAAGWRPGALRPFIRLLQTSYVLTYGSTRGGYAAVGLIVVASMIAAARSWRGRRLHGEEDRMVLLAASLVPVVWVLVLPQHTVIHAHFMVRILVASVALAPLAACWPSSAVDLALRCKPTAHLE
jgi:hypothetical protein